MKYSLLGVLALAGALAACSDSTSPAAGSRVTISFIDAAPRYAGVNLYVNSVRERHDQVPGTGYGSTYMSANSIPQTVVVTATGDTTVVLASTQVTFALDTQYTVVFTQHSTGGGLLVLPDTVSAPPLGDASFRLVNIAPSAGGTVDVYRTTGAADLTGLTPVASNVAFEAVSPYVSFPAGPTRIIVTAAGHPETVVYDLGISPYNFPAGQVQTILLMDADAPGGGTPLKILGLNDRG